MLRYKFGKISIAGIAYRLIGNDLSLSFPIAAPRTQGNWASRTAPAGVASRQGAAESLVPSAGFAATRSELQRAFVLLYRSGEEGQNSSKRNANPGRTVVQLVT